MKMVLFYMMVLFFFFIKGCFLMWTWALGTSFIFEYWVFHLLCRHVGINTKICCDQNPFDTQVYNLTRWSVYDSYLASIKWQLYKERILQKFKLSNVMLNFEERKIEIINYLCLSEERVIRWDINALAIWLKPDLWSAPTNSMSLHSLIRSDKFDCRYSLWSAPTNSMSLCSDTDSIGADQRFNQIVSYCKALSQSKTNSTDWIYPTIS